ncbi:MAG: CBS domain-containing protein [Deltaproteobacteria bacterium]|nr:CBS domain-containing protein [Deltaproteobacteria bacterium]
MAIGNIIRKNISYCKPTTPIQEVAQIMKEDEVGAVLILEAGTPKGIVTDRDIVIRCISEAIDPAQTPVEKIMTTGVEAVTVDQGIYEVAHKMKEASVRRVAVVDAAGNAVGLLSFDDVFDLLAEELSDLRIAVLPRTPKIINKAA